jgi:hypothetical protein
MNQERIKPKLLKENCDWFDFKFNTPKASHMGGVWERQIRTVRNVLNAILHKNGYQLNEESLRTFMCEAESIVNSRPVTVDNLSSPHCPEPLTPNHLLTMKSKIVLPPPFKRRICTCVSTGNECNTLAMNSGRGGGKSFCMLYKNDRNGSVQEEISRLMTLL